MATNKHRRKKHHKKGATTRTVKHRRHRHYKRKHSNTSLKKYLSSDNRDTNVLKDTVNISDPHPDTANNGNIINGLRDLLSNKKNNSIK
jgi:hypothetical protein